MYVLGIDGGGTKTVGVIVHSSGKVVAKAIVGATNPNSIEKSSLIRELTTLIETLKKENNDIFTQVKRAFAGMSGVEHPAIKKEMVDIITSILPKTIQLTVNNDAITALYSGTLGESGIVQIAGTGSITFGINERGEQGRVGGWGYLIGEQGSGFSLGSSALQAAFSAYDGLGEETELVDLIRHHFGEQSLPDIVRSVYHSKNTKELIASLSLLVVKAADNGDQIAKHIVKKNGVYIADAVSCLVKKLFAQTYQAKQIPVVLAGGMFNRFDLLEKSIQQTLFNHNINIKLIIPDMLPVGGAVVAALKEEQIEIHSNFPRVFSSR